MVFWIAILIGVGFVWLAIQLKFYATWVLFFNVLVSMYVSIFLAPAVADFAPVGGGAGAYGVALSMVVLAGGCFAILHGLSYVFLTGQFNIPFPRVFDVLLSGLLGFATGFLILSFVAIVLITTPLTQQKIAGTIGINRQSQQANIRCLTACCDLIHAVTRFGGDKDTTQAAIDHLIDIGNNSLGPKRDEQRLDANEPPAAPGKSPPRQGMQRRKIEDPSADMP